MRRWISAAAVGLLATTGMVALAAGPAAAGGCDGTLANAPDGRIRVDGSAWSGAGEFPSVSIAAGVVLGDQARYEVRFRNVHPDQTAKKLKVWAAHFKPDGYRIKYFVNGVNATAQVRQEKSLVFPNIAAGKSTPIIDVIVRNVGNVALEDGFTSLDGRYAGTPLGSTCDRVVGYFNSAG